MTTDIERVAATGGAPAVAFDHAAADVALAAVQAALVETAAHGLVLHTAAGDAAEGWEGAHRTEFEQARDVLDQRTATAIEALHAARRAILAAVDDANGRQLAANRRTAEAIIGPVPPR